MIWGGLNEVKNSSVMLRQDIGVNGFSYTPPRRSFLMEGKELCAPLRSNPVSDYWEWGVETYLMLYTSEYAGLGLDVRLGQLSPLDLYYFVISLKIKC